MIERIEEIFTEFDIRYNDPFNQVIIETFLKLGAISIKERVIRNDQKGAIIDRIKGPQRELKAIAGKLLKDSGFKILGYEIGFMGGIVDVLAEGKGKTIAVECGPCRLTKVIDYLENHKAELWIVKQDHHYVIRRGRNWKRIYDLYKKRDIENLRKTAEKAFEGF